MNTKLVTVASAVLFAMLLSFAGVASAAPGPKAAPAAAVQPAAVHPAAAAATPVPPHPEIREAVESLRRARKHLAEAGHDFGGHRRDAIRATDNAIAQLEICLRYE